MRSRLVLWGAYGGDVQVGSQEDRFTFGSLTIVDSGRRLSLTPGQSETLRWFYINGGSGRSIYEGVLR